MSFHLLQSIGKLVQLGVDTLRTLKITIQGLLCHRNSIGEAFDFVDKFYEYAKVVIELISILTYID
jgi:hypothetical protein